MSAAEARSSRVTAHMSTQAAPTPSLLVSQRRNHSLFISTIATAAKSRWTGSVESEAADRFDPILRDALIAAQDAYPTIHLPAEAFLEYARRRATRRWQTLPARRRRCCSAPRSSRRM